MEMVQDTIVQQVEVVINLKLNYSKLYYSYNFFFSVELTTRPETTSPGNKKQHEPPPSYTTLQRSPCTHRDTLTKTVCETYKQQQHKVILIFQNLK